MPNVQQKPMIIFDADDTLWGLEEIYRQVYAEVKAIAAGVGLDPEKFEQIYYDLELRNLNRHALENHWFPLANALAYVEASLVKGLEVSGGLVRRIFDQGMTHAKTLEAIAGTGVDLTDFTEFFKTIGKSTAERYGISSIRPAITNALAYVEAALMEGLDVRSDILHQIFKHCDEINYRQPVQFDGVRDALEKVKDKFTLIMLTRGSDEIQNRRIDHSGLRDLFDEINIVPEKNGIIFGLIAEKHGQNREDVWVIGNSPKSDIKPAVQIGMTGIWVQNLTWQAEMDDHGLDLDHPKVHIADNVIDAIQFLHLSHEMASAQKSASRDTFGIALSQAV